MDKAPFSKLLEHWHKGRHPKTLDGLSKVFAEKSFALIILLLLAPSALPLPTGGITNIFEVIAMILAVELVLGRKILWLPKKWRHLKLDGGMKEKVIPYIAGKVRWLESVSKPRLQGLMNDPSFLRVTGLLIFVLTFGSFVAPPFSGLDTLPSTGVVLICLSLILEDALLYALGLLVGGTGIALEILIAITLSSTLAELI